MYKLIKVTLVTILFVFMSACADKEKRTLNADEVITLATMYKDYYNQALYNYQPVIVTYKDTLVWEALYFDERREQIAVRTFQTPPYKQFLAQIKRNHDIRFSDALDNIESTLLNYNAADCPSIKKALADYKKVGLNYKHGNSYNYNPDKAIYTYVFIEHDNGGQTVEISTYVAEHPVSEIYRIAKKGVKDCPHPTEPPEVGPTEYRPLPSGD